MVDISNTNYFSPYNGVINKSLEEPLRNLIPGRRDCFFHKIIFTYDVLRSNMYTNYVLKKVNWQEL